MAVPLLLKDSLKMGLMFKYSREEFYFENPDQIEYPVYQRIEDHALNSYGVRWLFQKEGRREGHRWQGYAGVEMNGDRVRFDAVYHYLKLSVALFYMNRKNPRTELGYGLRFGYDLGIPLLLPLFSYQHHFSPRFSTSMVLPKQASMTYAFNPKTFLTAGAEISGASYHLENVNLLGYSRLETRKSEARLSLSFAREIHDWLWIEAESGGVRFINFFISEPRELRNNALITLSANESFFFNIKLLVMVPRRFRGQL
jgi:hypothetical protein